MATIQRSGLPGVRHGLAALLAIGALGLVSMPAAAQVPGVDFYIGAGIGQSDVDLNADDLGALDFDAKDTGWKLIAGVRVASMLGAELEYIDFGKPDGSDSSVDYKGIAAYGLLYAPLPLPILDLYAKAGLAKVDANLSVDGLGDADAKDTQFAYGLGAQLKFGSFALRGEWEKFKVKDGGASARPSLLSLSFTKSFL
ncbi:MAG TPA: porin family protein [Steroidobacteraceae bacterium]|nr:porin family protein [Steroidobacteraceae bacterium]